MPLSYGGGITTIEQVQAILAAGAEKVVINSAALSNPSLIGRIADRFGSQSVVVSVDLKKDLFRRYQLYSHGGTRHWKCDAIEYVRRIELAGAGELLVNSIDKDGTMEGYDLDLVRQISKAVNIPVVASGGAGKVEHFTEAVRNAGASAVAAGSFFVFYGKHQAVLINVPSGDELKAAFA